MRLFAVTALVASAVLSAGTLSACTSSGGGTSPTATRSTVGSSGAGSPGGSATAGSSAPVATAPLSDGKVTTKTASSCPFVTQGKVADTLGMRQGRITVSTAAGRVVACRYYALQGGSLHTSENLPGPDQPVLSIVLTRYASATAAHNAFVLASRAGTEAMTVTVGKTQGVVYRARFDPTDGDQDWNCGFSIGTTVVTLRSAQKDSADEVADLATRVAAQI